MKEILQVINYTLFTIFLLEAIVKIYCMKWKYFKDSWNTFDFIVLMITVIAIYMELFFG